MQKHYWTGICPNDRQQSIEAIAHCVSRYGTILNSALLSDIALSMMVEVDAGMIGSLHQDLSSLIRIDGANLPIPTLQTSSLLLLNITFTRGSGNLQTTIPEVPG
ncbi:MAG: hypothetical protein IT259_14655 [Saprospiraceae bacterium]|nr:hypothetical protein [Saprospiraceae bacterium]